MSPFRRLITAAILLAPALSTPTALAADPAPNAIIGPVTVSPATASGPASGGQTATLTVPGAVGKIPVFFGPTAGTILTELQVDQSGTPAARYTVLVPAGDAGTVDVTIGQPGGAEATETSDDDYVYEPSPTIDRLTPTEAQCGPTFLLDVIPGDWAQPASVEIGGLAFRTTRIDDDTISFRRPNPAFADGPRFPVMAKDRKFGPVIAGYLEDGCFVRIPPEAISWRVPGIQRPVIHELSNVVTQPQVISVKVHGIDSSATVLFDGVPGTDQRLARYTCSEADCPPGELPWRATAVAPVGPAGTVHVTVRTADGKITYGQTAASNDFEYLPSWHTIRSIAPASGPLAGGNPIKLVLDGLYAQGARPELSIGGAFVRPTSWFHVVDPHSPLWGSTVMTATAPPAADPGPIELRVFSSLDGGPPAASTYTYDDAAPTPQPTPTPTPPPDCFRDPAPDEAIPDYGYTGAGSVSLGKLLRAGARVTDANLAFRMCHPTGDVRGSIAFAPLEQDLRQLAGIRPRARLLLVATQPLTGTLGEGGILTASVKVRIKIPSVTALGIELAVGANCQVRQVSSITLTSQGDFRPLVGGTLTGTFTTSDLSGCPFLNGLVAQETGGTSNVIALEVARRLPIR